MKPLLIWDGECGFCRRWVESCQKKTGDRVVYEPYQTAAAKCPQLSLSDFQHSAVLVLPDGRCYQGAEAEYLVFSYMPQGGKLLWLYQHVPGFSWVSELGYRLVARHRGFFSKFF